MIGGLLRAILRDVRDALSPPPAVGEIAGLISDEAWSALTLGEQTLLLAVDDFERGRYDLETLRLRLALARQGILPRVRAGS